MAREYFDVKDEQLDELLCAVLRVPNRMELEFPLLTWRLNLHDLMTEDELRSRLASTRALFADAFRMVL